MKQDLQNLREEIKQLGREIRGQLKAIEPQQEEEARRARGARGPGHTKAEGRGCWGDGVVPRAGPRGWGVHNCGRWVLAAWG